MAVIKGGDNSPVELFLLFDEAAPYGIPSQFVNAWQVPENETGQPQIFEITVFAFQERTGNTGVDKATIIIQPVSTTTAVS